VRRLIQQGLVITATLAALLLGIACGTAGEQRKVVIPFDFVSKFDEGRYGQMVGDMVWKKLQREGGFIIPESMADTRDFCESNKIVVTPDTPMDKMKKIVQDDFGAHVAIWGSVERVPGNEWDVYDLVIKCVDFTAYPQPKVVCDVKARTQTVSEIPHLYVKQMLDALYDRKPGAPPGLDPMAEENWKKNPNLVKGGDFQEARRGVPIGWEPSGGQQREPLGGLVKWLPEARNPSNMVIRFTFDAGVGDTSGVMYYSEPFPVQEGAKYRFQCRWRSNGPAVKVFIKCYDEMGTEYHRESDSAKLPKYKPGKNTYIPEGSQLREVYRSQQNLKGGKNTWNVQTEDFTPKHTKYVPKWGKVMLYAYLGAGVVEFDDVVVKLLVPASPGESVKERRHSLESKVTIKDMEENERRSRQAREQEEAEEAAPAKKTAKPKRPSE